MLFFEVSEFLSALKQMVSQNLRTRSCNLLFSSENNSKKIFQLTDAFSVLASSATFAIWSFPIGLEKSGTENWACNIWVLLEAVREFSYFLFVAIKIFCVFAGNFMCGGSKPRLTSFVF